MRERTGGKGKIQYRQSGSECWAHGRPLGGAGTSIVSSSEADLRKIIFLAADLLMGLSKEDFPGFSSTGDFSAATFLTVLFAEDFLAVFFFVEDFLAAALLVSFFAEDFLAAFFLAGDFVEDFLVAIVISLIEVRHRNEIATPSDHEKFH